MHPRVVVPWPPEQRQGSRLLRLLREELATPPLDLVLVARSEELAGRGGLPPEQVDVPRELGAALARARAAGARACRFAPQESESSHAAATQLVREGSADALFTLCGEAQSPCLRLRQGVRVGDLLPAVPWNDLTSRLTPRALVESFRGVDRVLRWLGIARPRLLLFDLSGEERLRRAAEEARAAGLDLEGPLLEEEALGRRGDVFLGLTRAQVRMPLTLLGSGPETVFSLREPIPWAWPANEDEATVVAALTRLAEIAHGRGLAAGREESRRPTLSVSARQAPVHKQQAPGRCPYCHRDLEEAVSGGVGIAGPPALCVVCATPHHRDCLFEHGSCTVMGCEGAEATRLGVKVSISRLGCEDPQLARFEPLEGDAGSGPVWLRIEAPLDDPVPARARSVTVELAATSVRRGERLEGYVVVHSPTDFRVRGGLLRLRATLSTQKVDESRSQRPQPILARQATFVGGSPAGALGRLQDGVVALFAAAAPGEKIPAGVRRYPFSFEVSREHPPSLVHRREGVEETVTTCLEVELDTERCVAMVEVL